MKWMSGIMFAATLLAAGVAAAQTAFAPAVVVNDDIITYYDVEQRARLMQVSGASGGAGLQRAALENLIDERLQVQAAQRFQLEAADEDLAAAAADFAGRLGTDRPGLAVRLRSAGVEEGALVDLIRAQVVWRELVNRRYGPRATPSELELDQEIALAAQGQSRSFRLSEIALPVGGGREAQARELIERVRREALGGADFAALARRYSRTPTAKNGGEVGWVPESSLPPALAELIASTAPGGVTEPFEVPGGISIYKVADTRQEVPPWAREAEMNVRRIRLADDSEESVERAKEIADSTNGCESIPDLSDQATMDSLDSKLVRALPGPIRAPIQLLQAGQASAPIRTEGRVEVFVVCDRSGGMNAEERNQLRETIRTRRIARLAEGYLQELRREAVIEQR